MSVSYLSCLSALIVRRVRAAVSGAHILLHEPCSYHPTLTILLSGAHVVLHESHSYQPTLTILLSYHPTLTILLLPSYSHHPTPTRTRREHSEHASRLLRSLARPELMPPPEGTSARPRTRVVGSLLSPLSSLLSPLSSLLSIPTFGARESLAAGFQRAPRSAIFKSSIASTRRLPR